jgi:alkaline phosphatase D
MSQRFWYLLVFGAVVAIGVTLAMEWGWTARVAPAAASDDAAAISAGQVVTTTTVFTPTIVTAASLDASSGPSITHGPVSGEVTDETAVLWARGSEAGTLTFAVAEAAEDVDFSEDAAEATVNIDEAGDFIGEVKIDDLEANTAYLYRVTLSAGDETSDFVQGYFVTAPAAGDAQPFNFVFGSCLGGQGFCRDPESGWLIFDTMLAQNPDFFLITGDTVYVDSACMAPANVPGAEGPFNDLEGFRTRYRYHLEDEHYATFLAQTPLYVTWDDHEIRDDFGGPALSRVNPQMFAEGTQAFFDYWPLQETAAGDSRIYRSFRYGAQAEIILLDTRSYRDPNVNWDPHPLEITPKTMLGAEQFAWLQETLADSGATWKFIVTSTPLSYPTGFPQPEVDGRDGWANYTEKSGYEMELTALIFFIESQDIDNVVFLTGDTHWPFALSYDPDRDGSPNFHEFGSSPMSAIVLPPVAIPDPTFNPEVLYAEGEFQGTLFNFGHVSVDEAGSLTFRVVDREGEVHYTMTLDP